ncbi:MAG: hypothetical protein R2824_20380 [Saprospiraceae bacterium]|nr:hypothetical protein [Lewinella sp.]
MLLRLKKYFEVIFPQVCMLKISKQLLQPTKDTRIRLIMLMIRMVVMVVIV